MGPSEGSGKWVMAVVFAIALTVTLAYPHQVLFALQFVGGLILQNIQPLLPKHWPF